MISSDVRTIEYPNGEIQRVQLVKFDSLSQLDFFSPNYDKRAFDRVADLYEHFIVPSKPMVFGQLVLFHLPDNYDSCFAHETRTYGNVFSDVTAAAIALRKGVKILGGKPVFTNKEVKRLWHRLETEDYVRIVRGNLPMTTIIPVGDSFGFLSENEVEARLKVNSSFFIMDRFDCSTPYDLLGRPIGLMVKDGCVLNPPMYQRETLLCRNDGTAEIITTDIKNTRVEINGLEYRHGVNSNFYMRPQTRTTPKHKGVDIAVSGRTVIAVKKGGGMLVPSSGFVMTCIDNNINPGDTVSYHGFDDVAFAIQVGNSIIREGRKTEEFISPFYNIYKLWTTSFPPSLYPLDFAKARAPRIALGTDVNGTAMLAWVEGPGKFSRDITNESCGASLSEMADLCELLGFYNAVNLDGGGSAQILIDNIRSLRISDRNSSDFTECERAVPTGLIIR